MHTLPMVSRVLMALACLGLLIVPTEATATGPLTLPSTIAAGLAEVATQAPKKRRKRRRKKRRKKKKGAVKAPAKAGDTKDDKSPKADAAETPAKPQASGESNLGGLRRSNQMEFDARLVTGETAQSGAVYLFQRAPRQLPALVKLRQSYLRDIVNPVLGASYKPSEASKRKRTRKRRK